MSKISVDIFEDRSAAESVDAAYLVHGTAKAWAEWNLSGTAAFKSSLNMSSITDNGTGDTTLTLTNAFPSAEYCAPTSGDFGISGGRHITSRALVRAATASTYSTYSCNVESNVAVDLAFMDALLIGDLV